MGVLSCGCGSIQEIPNPKTHDKSNSNTFSQQKSTNSDSNIIKRIYSLTDNEDNLCQEKTKGRHSRTFRFEINDGGYSTSSSSNNSKNNSTILIFRKEIKTTISKTKLLLDNAEKISDLENDSLIKVLKIKSSTKDNETVVIDSSYIEGSSIRKIITRFKTTNENLIKMYLVSILNGLKYLHKRGIVHKNLTIDNIIITEDSKAIITDSLVDSILLGDGHEIVETYLNSSNTANDNFTLIKNNLQVKPYIEYLEYIPPFFVQDKKKRLNQSYDLWFLGCVLIQMKTGKGPWGPNKKELCSTPEGKEEFINFLKNTTRTPPIPDDFSDSMKSILRLLFDHKRNKTIDVYNSLQEHLNISQAGKIANENTINSGNVQIVSVSSINTGKVNINNLTPVVTKNEQLKNYLNSKGNASFSVSYLSDSNNFKFGLSSLQNSSSIAGNISLLAKSNRNLPDKHLYTIDDEHKNDDAQTIQQEDKNDDDEDDEEKLL